jgi:hypothetical protein
MKLYVYRISDREYGAGIGREKCEQLGAIVEEWPLNTPAEAKFLAGHGTSYHGASAKVSRIADRMHELMAADPTFSEPEPKPAPEPVKAAIEQPVAKPTLLQRILSCCYVR